MACTANTLQTEPFCQAGDLICLSIPPVTLTILGVTLQVQLPGFRVAADVDTGIISDLLGILIALLEAILGLLGSTATSLTTKKED